jgi:recombination endonuclease VII
MIAQVRRVCGAGYDRAMAKPGPKERPLDDPVLEARRLRRREQRMASYYRNYEANKIKSRDKSAARRADHGRYESEKTHYIAFRYGITVDDYERMFVEQDGKCAACGDSAGDRRLDVDHCHDSLKVRGLLCRKCNVALGLLSDSPERVMALAAYIMSYEDVLAFQNAKE